MRRMTIIALVAVAALAACAAPQPDRGYRTRPGQIASAALFDPARFADVWHVVAAYGGEAGCGPLSETWAPQGAGMFRVTGMACGAAGARPFVADARMSGPGRITRDGPGGRQEIWVLWVDADYRVAVIGTPDGHFGRILSRTPEVRGDLMAAAREVLDFNGYDVTRLALLQGE